MNVSQEIDARKERFDGVDAMGLLQGMGKMMVAKGQRVTLIDLKENRPDDATLSALMLGPTGNLRAPTMKVGKTVLVGFNEEAYIEVFD